MRWRQQKEGEDEHSFFPRNPTTSLSFFFFNKQKTKQIDTDKPPKEEKKTTKRVKEVVPVSKDTPCPLRRESRVTRCLLWASAPTESSPQPPEPSSGPSSRPCRRMCACQCDQTPRWRWTRSWHYFFFKLFGLFLRKEKRKRKNKKKGKGKTRKKEKEKKENGTSSHSGEHQFCPHTPEPAVWSRRGVCSHLPPSPALSQPGWCSTPGLPRPSKTPHTCPTPRTCLSLSHLSVREQTHQIKKTRVLPGSTEWPEHYRSTPAPLQHFDNRMMTMMHTSPAPPCPVQKPIAQFKVQSKKEKKNEKKEKKKWN